MGGKLHGPAQNCQSIIKESGLGFRVEVASLIPKPGISASFGFGDNDITQYPNFDI